MSRSFARVVCAVLMCGVAHCASAVDSIFALIGGDKNIVIYTAGVGWAPWWTMPVDNARRLSLSPIATVSYWDARKSEFNKSLIAVGAYPVLRFDIGEVWGIVPYIEGSVGFNLLSHVTIEARDLSTAFQFGEFFGGGFAFGDKRQYDLGFRYQHISNADIKRPNDGMSYGGIVFQYRFDAR